MAPEQIQGDAAMAPELDQWAAGVLAYRLVTGWKPFSGDGIQTVMNILQQPAPSMREKRPDIANELDLVVLRMLSKDPRKRYPDVRTAAKELRRFL